MDLARKRVEQSGIIFASKMAENFEEVNNDPEKVVLGIEFFKGLHRQPQRGDMIGLLAGSGVGKTSTCVNIARNVLEFNPTDLIVIISLEMTANEYLQKIMTCFGYDQPELLERCVIIDCYNSDGSNKELTVADMKLQVKKIKQTMNMNVAMVIADHFHEVHNNGSVDYNPVAKEFKNMAIECDTIMLLPSQTTKEKGLGDTPVPKNGCFGCSKYENLCSYILTIFQPLRRVQNECDLPALGWQFSKIRFKRGKKDTTKEEINYLLSYDSDTDRFSPLTPNEITTFQMHYEKVLELRESEEKKKSYAFDLSTTIKNKDGKEVRLSRIYTGGLTDND